jgi:hypothetical protein
LNVPEDAPVPPVTFVEMFDGSAGADETNNITPPPPPPAPGVPGADIEASTVVAVHTMYLAANMTIPPPTPDDPPAPPLRNVGVVPDALTAYPLIA